MNLRFIVWEIIGVIVILFLALKIVIIEGCKKMKFEKWLELMNEAVLLTGISIIMSLGFYVIEYPITTYLWGSSIDTSSVMYASLLGGVILTFMLERSGILMINNKKLVVDNGKN